MCVQAVAVVVVISAENDAMFFWSVYEFISRNNFIVSNNFNLNISETKFCPPSSSGPDQDALPRQLAERKVTNFY